MSDAKCPLSGISCDDCGYREISPRDCFLVDLIDALEALNGSDEYENT